MAAERWAHVASIVEQAMALPPDSLPDYLRAACGEDVDLSREVASLLAHHQEEEALRASRTPSTTPDLPSGQIPRPWVNERFERLEWLGTGGFGVVYRAYDRAYRQWVALKVLRNVDPVRLDRFKREFRKTTTISHPNVVRLYELFANGDQWFFTMELIDGLPILDYIRAPGPWTTEALTTGAWLQRLYQTFEQLVEGVSSLHAAGIVHGDLKPQNVLVSTQGRVVLLDFGLARDIAQQPSLVAGTPAYMAPEQLGQAPVAEPADWYSVGVLLYEALTTTVPFTGTFWEVLWKKQGEDARLPATSHLPEAIVSLCHALLRRQPDQRPSGPEILERLVGRRAEETVLPGPDPQRLFVGRRQHLDVLREAFDRVGLGRPTAVHVQGASGIGKSTLVRHFLDTIRREHGEIVVLAGRCHESESVPFKALDELVDGLSRYLGQLEAADVDALMPRDLSLLTRVFPALRRVPAIGPERHPADAPPVEDQRDRALSALRELLERLAVRKRVVLWIDDLQWGDFDSLRVLRDLQQPSDAPCLLLILSYRSQDIGTSPVLQAVKDSAREGKATGTVRELAVNELLPEECHELAAMLCGVLPEGERAAIVHEAGGSPLFLLELARHVTAAPGSATHVPNLSAMIQQRIQRLPPSSRRLLDVIAVAGQPLERQIAIQASDPEDAGAESQLAAEFLIRASRSTATGELDTYHDKVREAALGLMSDDERRAWHGRLARTLEADGSADPERLVQHFTKAGIEEAAYRCALQAGHAAENCLAFDQAASLYRLALDLQARLSASPGLETLDAGDLWRRLAHALAGAGRSAEAANAYLQAAERASARDRGDLRSLAVDQLLRSGQINEGLGLLTTILREQSMRIPGSRGALLGAVAATRVRIRLRGLGFREHQAHEVPPAVLTHIDRLWTAGATLTLVDPMLSSYIRGQHLLLALRAGEPYRISVGLALEAVQRIMGGARGYPGARRILDRAREIAVKCGRPHGEAMVLTAEAGVAYFSGRVRDAFRFGAQGEEILRTQCTGVAWELAASRLWILSALALSGRWKEHGIRLATILHEADRNGDRYAQCALPLTAGCHVSYLAADDPGAARRVLDEKIAQWARSQFDFPRLSHWYGSVEVLLYEGRYEEAWQLVTKTWPVMRRTLIFRIEFLRLLVGQLRARCAVALHSVAPRPAVLVIAERFVSASAGSSSTLVQGWGLLIDAALTAARGHRNGAIAKLQLAEERLGDAGALQFAAASRRRRGELMDDPRGTALIRTADAELVELGAVNPRRATDRLIPGVFSSGKM
jgi:hypothetical protein